MKEKDISAFERDHLIKVVEELRRKLHKDSNDLQSARRKLSAARLRIRKLKDIVDFQRNRILELYE